jgi:hypothetical protein
MAVKVEDALLQGNPACYEEYARRVRLAPSPPTVDSVVRYFSRASRIQPRASLTSLQSAKPAVARPVVLFYPVSKQWVDHFIKTDDYNVQFWQHTMKYQEEHPSLV